MRRLKSSRFMLNFTKGDENRPECELARREAPRQKLTRFLHGLFRQMNQVVGVLGWRKEHSHAQLAVIYFSLFLFPTNKSIHRLIRFILCRKMR